MDRESDRVLMDRQAYRDLLDRYWSPLVTYAAGIVDSSDSAQDVVQDVFIRVLSRDTQFYAVGGHPVLRTSFLRM